MTTNPEQKARAAVENPRCVTHAPHDHAVLCARPALDRLCTERYLAGRIYEHELRCDYCDAVLSGAKFASCPPGTRLRAEYAACVAAIQEAAK